MYMYMYMYIYIYIYIYELWIIKECKLVCNSVFKDIQDQQ